MKANLQPATCNVQRATCYLAADGSARDLASVARRELAQAGLLR
jgi:hypothetical protein